MLLLIVGTLIKNRYTKRSPLIEVMTMFKVSPIAIFEDNYVWIIESAGKVAVVDPGDAQAVLAYLKNHDLNLDYILITHKHWDHVNGIKGLKAIFPNCLVYGTAHEDVPFLDKPLNEEENETFELMELNWRVIHTPGHTLGHIALYVFENTQTQNPQGHLFSGDNLFACGCGRMFEGTAKQFQNSLARLTALPANTLVYATHEYTLANINFALHIEPNNTYTLHRQDVCTQLREQGKPTLPTTIGDELKSNPFVRWNQPDVIRAAEHFSGLNFSDEALSENGDYAAEVFGVIRKMKDGF